MASEDPDAENLDSIAFRNKDLNSENSYRGHTTRDFKNKEISFKIVQNDDKSDSLILLAGLKNIFQRQLPKMPKEYIARLVFDKNHTSLSVIKNNSLVVGGITYRLFNDRNFAEIVFCAVSSSEQVKGFGSHMMNRLKDHISTSTDAHTFLTYADNYAIGYFKKQATEITLDKRLWMGYIKDYEGGTLMQCTMVSRVKYVDSKKILNVQRNAVLEKIKTLSKSHIIYTGLTHIKDGYFPVDPYSIPGVAESGWTVEMDSIGRSEAQSKLQTWQENLVSEMQVHPSAWAFLQPVDDKEVPDYYLHIKNPMDLATLMENIKTGKYDNLETFIYDTTLIFNNAREYNGDSSRYGRCASNLQKYFDQKVADWKKKFLNNT
ncbi:hypothetical protein BB561_004376 [Smittium simulii]|uniref:histone acetyltransferase n=1 Tax=Smittium simulii TaxID=133385 RepID=A0A2T9YGS0_9FUNG|nr:hypothetical protein BB561_004376 [Smittium simulii]